MWTWFYWLRTGGAGGGCSQSVGRCNGFCIVWCHSHLNRTRTKVCYRPQTKSAKVMFLHVSVCPQVGVCSWESAPGGFAPGGGSAPRGFVPSGGLLPGGLLPVGGLLPRGLLLEGLQAHTQAGSPGLPTPITATAAGSMHPSGMRSCFLKMFISSAKVGAKYNDALAPK